MNPDPWQKHSGLWRSSLWREALGNLRSFLAVKSRPAPLDSWGYWWARVYAEERVAQREAETEALMARIYRYLLTGRPLRYRRARRWVGWRVTQKKARRA